MRWRKPTSLDDAQAWARVAAYNGVDAQETYEELFFRFPELTVQQATEALCSSYRSVQEQQIRINHDRTIVEAIEEGVLDGPQPE